MKLACNINQKGRLARLIYGLILIGLDALLAWRWAAPAGSAARWIVVAALFVLGIFGLFEAAVGWCAMRAMGFKTRM
jgi:hypothetical protein